MRSLPDPSAGGSHRMILGSERNAWPGDCCCLSRGAVLLHNAGFMAADIGKIYFAMAYIAGNVALVSCPLWGVLGHFCYC